MRKVTHWHILTGTIDAADGEEPQRIPAVAEAKRNGSHEAQATGMCLPSDTTDASQLSLRMEALHPLLNFCEDLSVEIVRHDKQWAKIKHTLKHDQCINIFSTGRV